MIEIIRVKDDRVVEVRPIKESQLSYFESVHYIVNTENAKINQILLDGKFVDEIVEVE